MWRKDIHQFFHKTMAKGRIKSRLKRYFNVYIRGIKRLNRKKISLWFKKNFKEHPFVLGILVIIWLNTVLFEKIFVKINIIKLVKFHSILFLAWFISVVILNLLKDKNKVKWYLRKRFVFIMLLFLPPLGLILLWSGAQFKKVSKITLSVIFAALFIISQVYSYKEHEKLKTENPIGRITEMISKPKKKINLKTIDSNSSANFKIPKIPKRARMKLAVSEIAAKSSGAIVSIKTMDKEGRELGSGSGFVISKDGIIVTNFHVLESAYQVEVKIADNELKDVYLIKSDPSLDIAILKVSSDNLSSLPIGNSDNLINGQVIVVIGNPWGFERSVSSGIISGIRSRDDIKVIQMTAPVSPGSSGGPVLNEYGEVIGITTLASFLIAQNLNFAIPINYLNKVIEGK